MVAVPKNLREFRAWSTTHQGKKLIRFTLSSVITTGVSAVAILVVYGDHIITGIIGATLFGNLLATIPSYYLSRAWAWGKHGRSHVRKEVLPYLMMSFAGIAFSLFGAIYTKHLVHTLQAQLAAAAPSAASAGPDPALTAEVAQLRAQVEKVLRLVE